MKRMLLLAMAVAGCGGVAWLLADESREGPAAQPAAVEHRLARVAAAEAALTGDACLAAAWATRLGSSVALAAAYQFSAAPLERPGGSNLTELAAAARRIGFSGTQLHRRAAPAAAWTAMQHQLREGLIVLTALPAAAGGDPPHVLVVGVRPGREGGPSQVLVFDPRTARTTAVDDHIFLSRWPASKAEVRWLTLPLRGGRLTQPPDVSPHGRLQYARLLQRLRSRIADRPFTIHVQQPFVVIGDLPAAQTKRWAKGTVHWAVQRMKAQYFARDPRRIVEIWLFPGRDSYRRYAKELFGDRPSTPYGYYSPRHGALIMNIETGGGTLVHEILHPFMEANFPDCPSWFNEGLASLYEQSADRDGRIWGLTNWRLAGLQRAIRADGVPDFKQLCGTSRAEFYDDRSGVHYAQARYLCYYLQQQGKLAEFYRRFRRRASQDPGGYQTLVEVLEAKDMQAFQKQWEQFVLGLRFP